MTPRTVQQPAEQPRPRVGYTVSVEPQSLLVEMQVATGGLYERTPLQLPAAQIEDLEFEGNGGFVTEVDGNDQVWVEHKESFTLRYRVRLDRTPSFERRKMTSALWEISERGFMTAGGFLWIVPLIAGELDVSFTWNDVPQAYTTQVHSLPGEQRQQGNLRAYEVIQCVHIVGSFETHEAGGAVLLSLADADVSPEAMLSTTNQVLDSAEAFFGGPAPERFVVIVLPETARRSDVNVSGNALTNGAIVWHQKEWPLLRQFLAHEIVHHWNPWHELDDVDWFVEGVTDFIAALLLFEADVISVAELAEEANAWHRTYFARILDPEFAFAEGDPRYEVGFMLGAQWFRHPKFRDTIAGAYADRVDRDELLRRIQQTFGISPKAIAAYVDGTSPIKPAMRAFGDCVALEPKPQGEQDLGFNAERTAKREKFVGVTKDGPAYKAGIREGMRFRTLRFSIGGTFVSSEVEITLGNGKEIRYFPSRQPYLVPMYVPSEDARTSAGHCRQFLQPQPR